MLSEAVRDPQLRMEVEMTPDVILGMAARAKGGYPAIALFVAIEVAYEHL